METHELLVRARRLGLEPTNVEAKAAVGKLPASVVDTISAFANGAGGTLLLGVDEAQEFAPATGFDPGPIQDALADACANKVTPPCRASIDLEEWEGRPVIRLDVTELDPIDKPCFVTARGAYGGSFIRGGDGDRRLNHYEVTQLLSNRTQPTFDAEPVERAVQDDLDAELIETYLARVRRRSPVFRHRDDEWLLLRLGVLARDKDGELRPTLAGLLTFGQYPQEFFPQLFVSFVVLPRVRMGDPAPDGRRFLDNQSLDGPIATIVQDALDMARRNMRVGAVIRDAGREDHYDFPVAVIRELVVNALMHRDYSPDARGTQIQIELYPDRLVVKSPGGLFGPITVADLGSEDLRSTSRNQTLARLLADSTLPEAPSEALCENRGSGLLSVLSEMRRVGMSPPEFAVTPGGVTVRVPQHALLGPETSAWIASLGHPGLDDAQQLALAMMRVSGQVTNPMLQAWGVDPLAAGRALRDLVEKGLAVSSGGRRYATYRLLNAATESTAEAPLHAAGSDASRSPLSGIEAELQATLHAIRAGSNTRQDLLAQLNLSPRTLARRLEVLLERGAIERTEPARSSRQTYRIIESTGDAR